MIGRTANLLIIGARKINNQYNTQSWVNPSVIINESSIDGQGGFARELIKKDEIVVILGGVVFTDTEFEAFIATAIQWDAVQIDENLHLVDLSPNPRATNGSLNHSCDSNLWMKDEITIIARRDIVPGEELTIDYALFSAQPHWVLDRLCQCGSPLCRHTITGNDWQIAAVQKRYKDHFSPFINERIAKLSTS